jgi:hypothetical protein
MSVDNAPAQHFTLTRNLTAMTRKCRPGLEHILCPRIAAEMMLSDGMQNFWFY